MIKFYLITQKGFNKPKIEEFNTLVALKKSTNNVPQLITDNIYLVRLEG